MDAKPEIYKSRLVAKGFRQSLGINYDDSYAPVVRMTALRALLSIAIHRKMYIHVVEVKNPFLNHRLVHGIWRT